MISFQLWIQIPQFWPKFNFIMINYFLKWIAGRFWSLLEIFYGINKNMRNLESWSPFTTSKQIFDLNTYKDISEYNKIIVSISLCQRHWRRATKSPKTEIYNTRNVVKSAVLLAKLYLLVIYFSIFISFRCKIRNLSWIPYLKNYPSAIFLFSSCVLFTIYNIFMFKYIHLRINLYEVSHSERNILEKGYPLYPIFFFRIIT